MHDVMTDERGGGDTVVDTTELPDETELGDVTQVPAVGDATVLDTTELPDQSEIADATELEDVTQVPAVDDATEAGDQEDEDENQDSDVTQLQQDLKDATLGATTALTFGPADAEGTRIQLEYEDSEMMDVDE
jgi:condensin complex subunit 3